MLSKNTQHTHVNSQLLTELPLTHEFLLSQVHPTIRAKLPVGNDYRLTSVTQALQNAQDLTTYGVRGTRSRSDSEIDLIRRVIRHHQETPTDVHKQAELEWECLARWMRLREQYWVQRAHSDGRLHTILRRALDALLKEQDLSVEAASALIQKCNITTRDTYVLLGLEMASELKAELKQFIQPLKQRIFEFHLRQALTAQEAAPEGQCLMNLLRLIECPAAYPRIRELQTIAHATCSGSESSIRDSDLDRLEIALQLIIPQICPELNTGRDIQVILHSYDLAWDGKETENGPQTTPLEFRIWLHGLMDHMSSLCEDPQSVQTYAYHLRDLIYQMRTAALYGCLNRIWYEWHLAIMLYWNHAFEDSAERIDWIALRWKQQFLEFQVQTRFNDGRSGAIELEVYRNNEVFYDGLLRLGCTHHAIAYSLHRGPEKLILPDIVFGHFFKSLEDSIDNPILLGDWAQYILRACPATRRHHGIPYNAELLRSRIGRWLAGDGPNGDIQPLAYAGTIDYAAVRRSLSTHFADMRQHDVDDATFEGLKPHIRSLRRLLELYIDSPDYANTEAWILQYLLEIQADATIATNGLSPHEKIMNLAAELHAAYENERKRTAGPVVMEVLTNPPDILSIKRNFEYPA